MKPIRALTAATLLLTASHPPVAAQNFTMPRFDIDGGGGVSADAAFRVEGAIGKPVCGEISDSPFTLRSGFWFLSPTPPAGIGLERLGNRQVRASWALPGSGLVLYHSTNLTDWAPLAPPYITNQSSLSVIRSARSEFFKLRKP